MPDTGRYGLPRKVFYRVIGVLTTHSDVVEEAILYGSRATGRYYEGSDIDIALKFRADRNRIYRIRDELDQLNVVYTFDTLGRTLVTLVTSKANFWSTKSSCPKTISSPNKEIKHFTSAITYVIILAEVNACDNKEGPWLCILLVLPHSLLHQIPPQDNRRTNRSPAKRNVSIHREVS